MNDMYSDPRVAVKSQAVATCELCGGEQYEIFPYEEMGLCSKCARTAGAAWCLAHGGYVPREFTLDGEEGPAVRAKVPSKSKIPEKLRWRVFERDGFACLRCGSRSMLRADHVVPESKGGPTTFENLQTLCDPCNCRKGRW